MADQVTETIANADGQPTRKVSGWLWLGIFLLPYAFSWLTLRKGYTTRDKSIAFVWFAIYALISAASPKSGSTSASESARRDTAPVEAAHSGWPFGNKTGPYKVVIDSNIADAIALTCKRNDETSLDCTISSKMPVRASLSPLEFVCYKGDVKVRSNNMYEDIDALGKLQYTQYCFKDFDRVMLRQRARSY